MEKAPIKKLTVKEIVGLIPAQAFIDFDRAKEVMDMAFQVQRDADHEYYTAQLAKVQEVCPELMVKAISVIEGSLLLDEPEDKRLRFIYRMAHVGRGECEHKEWIQELETCYQQMIEDNIISPLGKGEVQRSRPDREKIAEYLFVMMYPLSKWDKASKALRASFLVSADQIIALGEE